jgi:hypothetical protein
VTRLPGTIRGSSKSSGSARPPSPKKGRHQVQHHLVGQSLAERLTADLAADLAGADGDVAVPGEG